MDTLNHSSNARLEQAAAAERLRLNLEQVNRIQQVTPLAWVVVILLVWERVPIQALWLWAALAAIVLMVTLSGVSRLRRRHTDPEHCLPRLYAFSVLDGLAWGVLPFLLMGHSDALDLALLAVLCAVGGLSGAARAISFPAAGLHLAAILAPVLVYGLLHSARLMPLMVAVTACFALLFLRVNRTGQLLHENVRLKLENEMMGSQLKATLDHVSHQSSTDTLTGCANRRALQTALEARQRRLQLHGAPFAILLLDIDQFKKVNDAHGLSVGDEVIQAFAARAANRLRPSDMLARIGGEEFVALIDGASMHDAMQLARRICETMADTPVLTFPHTVSVTASIGVAAGHAKWTPTQLMHAADLALFEAKAQGCNRVSLATPPDAAAAAASAAGSATDVPSAANGTTPGSTGADPVLTA